MADKPIEAAPSPAPEVTPVVAAPVAEVVSEPTVLSVQPEIKAEIVPEEKPAEVKTEEKPAEEAPKVEEKKPEEKPVEEKKPEEAKKPVEAERPLPVFEKFALPEGVTMPDEKMAEFTSMLAGFETVSKADHTESQRFGQALIDYHVAAQQELYKSLQTAYTEAWKTQTLEWKKQFEADQEIGGNRKDTTVKAAHDFIRNHGGTEAQQKEFRDLMGKTGLGNHPAMIRILANAGLAKTLNEGTPIPAQAPASNKGSKLERMYGTRKK